MRWWASICLLWRGGFPRNCGGSWYQLGSADSIINESTPRDHHRGALVPNESLKGLWQVDAWNPEFECRVVAVAIFAPDRAKPFTCHFNRTHIFRSNHCSLLPHNFWDHSILFHEELTLQLGNYRLESFQTYSPGTDTQPPVFC